MKNRSEFLSMALTFGKILLGKSYFHGHQGIGSYFKNSKGYYNNLTKKAYWKGEFSVNHVPLLTLSSTGEKIEFPIMIIQYGLGSFELYLKSKEKIWLDQIESVINWINISINSSGYMDNRISAMDPGFEYWSSNSAMAQGQALSLIFRYISIPGANQLLGENLMHRIYKNMIKSVRDEGTIDDDSNGKIRFCEFCRKDKYVVLNGWIYALFGVYDYWRMTDSPLVREKFEASISTLVNDIHCYSIGDGWSYYDNKKRKASPHYQDSHVNLLFAIGTLSNNIDLVRLSEQWREGYTLLNKIRYSLIKIYDRLNDSSIHSG